MPTSNMECFQVFLDCLSRKFARSYILLVLDGAPNHRCRDLVLPGNISLLFLPPYSPELNPKENVWHEIREKVFKNYALKSIDAVRAKLEQAILYLEHNPDIIKSITGFPIHHQVTLIWRRYQLSHLVFARPQRSGTRSAFCRGHRFLRMPATIPSPAFQLLGE